MQINFTVAPVVDAGPSTINVCENNTTVNVLGTVSGSTTTGKWTTAGNGIFLPNNLQLSSTYQLGTADITNGSVMLYLESTSNGNCITVYDSLLVSISSAPIVNAGVDQTICVGASVTLSGSGAATYTWNNGVTNGVAFAPAATTTYTVTGTTAAGCINTDQVVVTVNPIPTVFAGNDISICEGQTVTLTGSGASTYSWNNGATNGATFTPPVGTITYTITGTTAAGCTNTDQVIVTVNPIPAVTFTPDVTYVVSLRGFLSACGSSTGNVPNINCG
jgi:hypothetical protein